MLLDTGKRVGHRQMKFDMVVADKDIYIYFLIYIRFMMNGCRKGQPKG
jgi:hypothetical protein